MNKIIKILLSLCIAHFSASAIYAQETTTIKGRIISEDFELLPGVKVFNMDTTILGSTDLDGYFEAEVPIGTNELLLGLVGMEWMTVKIEGDCTTLEMIMMTSVIYDFIPIKKINRKRCKRFRRLPKRHFEAYEQGIFTTSTPCISYIFKDH